MLRRGLRRLRGTALGCCWGIVWHWGARGLRLGAVIPFLKTLLELMRRSPESTGELWEFAPTKEQNDHGNDDHDEHVGAKNVSGEHASFFLGSLPRLIVLLIWTLGWSHHLASNRSCPGPKVTRQVQLPVSRSHRPRSRHRQLRQATLTTRQVALQRLMILSANGKSRTEMRATSAQTDNRGRGKEEKNRDLPRRSPRYQHMWLPVCCGCPCLGGGGAHGSQRRVTNQRLMAK